MNQIESIQFLYKIQTTINTKLPGDKPFHFNLDITSSEIRILFPYGPMYYRNARTDKENAIGTLVFSGETLEEAVQRMRTQLFSGGNIFGIHFVGHAKYRMLRPRITKTWDIKVAITCPHKEPVIEITGEVIKQPLYVEQED